MFFKRKKQPPVPQLNDWGHITREMVEATTPANPIVIDWGDLPPASLLSHAPAQGLQDASSDGQRLVAMLATFGARATLKTARRGAIVTVYDLQLDGTTKLAQVKALENDIAVRMGATSATVSHVPGTNVCRIEIASANRATITPRKLFEALESAPGALPVVIGETVDGQPHIVDLTRLPHLLIAGTTGSGKSVLLNCILLSLLARQTPDECQLVLIDPKMLEFKDYEDLYHLCGKPIITDAAAALETIEGLCAEMDARYKLMSLYGARSIDEYNAQAMAGNDLPRIVCMIDEYADLISDAKTRKALESAIQRIAQKARAAGIHLILATQRPSADVLTSVIKSNFPQRIAMRVPSAHDSRVILGRAGAETLAGYGDMYFGDTRLHCPFVTSEDIAAVTGFWRD
ncbi:MAG: DNA translocase FtsK [Micavibrio sp.]